MTASITESLPMHLIVPIAEFLPKTQRLLFAVALTAPSTSWRAQKLEGKPNKYSRQILAIHSSSYTTNNRKKKISKHRLPLLDGPMRRYYAYDGWGMLDFIDLDSQLCGALSDDDMYAMLLCIDAPNNLKILKLSDGPRNIIGHGLDPLRKSNVIEQIDLSLVELFQSPDALAIQCCKLSGYIVASILDSIIGQSGNRLKKIQLPKAWTHEKIDDSIPLQSRKIHMLKNESFTRFERRGGSRCYVCLADSTYSTCSSCEKTYCQDCVPIFTCDVCHQKHCLGCEFNTEGHELECESCNRWMGSKDRSRRADGEDQVITRICHSCWGVERCDHCERTRCKHCISCNVCQSCTRSNCVDCQASEDNRNAVSSCTDCKAAHCFNCKLRDDSGDCKTCQGSRYPRLLAAYDRLGSEMICLREVMEFENSKLQSENRKLRNGLETLSEQLSSLSIAANKCLDVDEK